MKVFGRLVGDVVYLFGRYILSETLLPLRRRYLALVLEITVFIDLLCFDDVEYDFRRGVTADGALALLALDLIVSGLEIGDTVDRMSVIYHVTTRIKDDHLIEHLVYLRRRLVDNHKNKFSFEGQLPQKVHYILRVP